MLVRVIKTGLYRQGPDIIQLFPGEVVDLIDPFNPNRGDLSGMIEPASRVERKTVEPVESPGGVVTIAAGVEVVMLKSATYFSNGKTVKLDQGKTYTVPADVASQLREKGKLK